MKKLIFILILTAVADGLFADGNSLFTEAFETWLTNTNAALVLYRKAVKSSGRDYFSLLEQSRAAGRTGLYTLFIKEMPDSPEKAEYWLSAALTGPYFSDIPSALFLYLSYAPPSAAAARFARELSAPEVSAFLLPGMTNSPYFEAVRIAHIYSGAYDSFDSLLARGSHGAFPDGAVLSWVRESIVNRLKDYRPLLQKQGLTNREAILYTAFGAAAAQDYALSLRLLKLHGLDADAPFAPQGLDTPLLAARSSIMTGDYTGALDYLGKLKFPGRTDRSYWECLVYLGLTNTPALIVSSQRVQDPDARAFFLLLGASLQGTNGIRSLAVQYVSNTTGTYMLEALVLYDALTRGEKEFEAAAYAVRAHVLLLPALPAQGLTGVYHALAGQGNSDSGLYSDYTAYRRARLEIERGNTEAGRDILLGLVRETKTSALVRQLAVYALRGLGRQ